MANEEQKALPAPGSSVTIEAYRPGSFTEAKEMAQLFVDAKAVKDVTNQGRAFLIMSTGDELGIPPAAALRIFYIFGDRVGMSAAGKMGLCLSRKEVCKYFVERHADEKSATYETWRVGNDKPDSQTYTIDDALTQFGREFIDKEGGAWKKTRRRMLRWRAIGELADRVYPDILLGLATIDDEGRGEIIDMKPLDIGSVGMLAQAQAAASAGAAIEKQERAAAKAAAAEVLNQAGQLLNAPAQAAGGGGVSGDVVVTHTKNIDTVLSNDRFARWQKELDACTAPAEVDGIAKSIQESFAQGSPERDRGRLMVKAAKDRVKTQQQRAAPPPPAAGEQQSLPSNPIDRAAEREREPGSDDE